MKKYSVITEHSKEFKLLDSQENIIAAMTYPKWWAYDVEIRSDGGNSTVKMDGTWSTAMLQLDSAGAEVRTYKMTWTGVKVIERNGIEYSLEMSSLWKYEITLKNRAGSPLIKITAKYNSNSLIPDYTIEVADFFEADAEFLLALVHCINCMSMSGG